MVNPNHKVMEYSDTTGTTVLCGHLIDDHSDEWIPTCKALCISITAKDAQPALVEYEHWHGNPRLATTKTTTGTHMPFSNEAFVDALTEFIIADDQVLLLYHALILTPLISLLLSQSTLLSADSLGTSFLCCGWNSVMVIYLIG